MVKLNKIYTKTGDSGETGLVGGGRIAKDDIRVETIGAVDELNAALGLARLIAEPEISQHILHLQHDIFDLGADLATPDMADAKALRITEPYVTRLETAMDALNEKLAPLTSFILPGGTATAAYLHMARTLARRAERTAFHLNRQAAINPLALQYLNRLSDYLFVMARTANAETGDVLWAPGHNR